MQKNNNNLHGILVSDKLQHNQLEKILSSQVKNLLGQEFNFAIYDATEALNLENLAIIIGTIKRSGALYVLFNHWDNLALQLDKDSIRWNDLSVVTATPNFYQYLQNKIFEYGFSIIKKNLNEHDLFFVENINNMDATIVKETKTKKKPTLDQSAIINTIFLSEKSIFCITAARGRGKSALAGFLIEMLSNSHQKVIITAPNKQAITTVQKFTEHTPPFLAPDVLMQKIEISTNNNVSSWLIIDEAAKIPIPILNKLINSFSKVVLLTTIHGYEGTGRGFLLKLIKNLAKPYLHFNLTQPLRWDDNDVLEAWLFDLLMLDIEDRVQHFSYGDYSNQISKMTIEHLMQKNLVEDHMKLRQFYALLMLAHYKTSPVDLRRIFDASRQHFWVSILDKNILACLVAIEEGEIFDQQLIEKIYEGTRRPKGNLVPQLLCYHYKIKEICQLKSLRISRIAVQSDWQQKELGSNLVKKVISFAREQQYDYVSVSFGYTEKLMQFWEKNGFKLLRIGKHLEASSGCYNAIVIYPISKVANALAKSYI